MPRPSALIVDSFAAVGLADVDALAAAPDRIDTKYVISVAEVVALAERLRSTHAVLEIEGRREFAYRTTYFDTAELRMFRDHMQRRRRRYKCRSREYVDSGLCMFEVKLKAARGRTVKHRMVYDRALRDELSTNALGFVRDCVAHAYAREPDGVLAPALVVEFTRITFAAADLGERVTCDFGVVFSAPDGTSGRLVEDSVIVECKSSHGATVADRALRALAARPQSGCSKYCLGVAFTRPRVKSNDLRPLLTRYFRPAPIAAVAPGLDAAGRRRHARPDGDG